MSETGLLNAFASHPFLHGLSEQHRLRLATAVRPFHASPGEFLAREGESATAFYLLQSGRVALGTRRGAQGFTAIQVLGPGDVVGWSWLVAPHRWQFDARATEAAQGLALDALWLREQCELDHELGYHLLKQLLTVLSSRLAASRKQRLETSQ